MINNLNEAIAHTKERARTLRECTKPFGYKPVLGATKKYIEHCLERAEYNEQLAAWLEELAERRKSEPIVYEVTENSQGFTVETNDDRNIGLKKVSTSNLIYAMREITEKYWDEGLRVVFKYYCGNGDEWQKFYESEEK